MKQKLLALALVLLLIPTAVAAAAQTGFADSLMDGCYAVIGGDQAITIRSHADPGGRGGYSHALYAVELTGEETKAELDAVAVRLLENGVQPLWGGSKHCYHGGDYTVDTEYTLEAADFAPGSYLYVCYTFGCEGGDYNHFLIPYYERISTMSVRITRQVQPLDLRYALVNGQGEELARLTDGGEAALELADGAVFLQLLSDAEYPAERIVDIQARFPEDQAAQPFTFDEATLKLTPVLCGSGSITVTIGNYLDDEVRTETIQITVPCAPMDEPTVMTPATCTENGLAAYCCRGYGQNCETTFDQILLPATGHELLSVSQYLVKPTATLPGIGVGTCHKCGLADVAQEVPPIFSDVTADAFYSEALDYCHAKGWVSGVTETTFAPGGSSARAQVVTFLWRASGSPEPCTEVNPFVDVSEKDFYYKAVLWAVENDITTGTDETHFSPGGICNRAQVVTFLWRAFGQPQAEAAEHPFTDVPAGSWFEQPVLWAVENGITSGMTATAFGPGASCNRAQIVTFLYRAYAE